MTRILVLSDSHGNQQLLRKPFSLAGDFSHIIHLGDNYNDLDENPDLLANRLLTRVPGNYHPGFLDGSLPRTLQLDIDGWNFFLVHDPELGLRKNPDDSDFVLYGHTHRPGFARRNGTLWANPGHLKRNFDRGHPASWMIIDLTDTEATLVIRDLDGATLHETTVKR